MPPKKKKNEEDDTKDSDDDDHSNAGDTKEDDDSSSDEENDEPIYSDPRPTIEQMTHGGINPLAEERLFSNEEFMRIRPRLGLKPPKEIEQLFIPEILFGHETPAEYALRMRKPTPSKTNAVEFGVDSTDLSSRQSKDNVSVTNSTISDLLYDKPEETDRSRSFTLKPSLLDDVSGFSGSGFQQTMRLIDIRTSSAVESSNPFTVATQPPGIQTVPTTSISALQSGGFSNTMGMHSQYVANNSGKTSSSSINPMDEKKNSGFGSVDAFQPFASFSSSSLPPSLHTPVVSTPVVSSLPPSFQKQSMQPDSNHETKSSSSSSSLPSSTGPVEFKSMTESNALNSINAINTMDSDRNLQQTAIKKDSSLTVESLNPSLLITNQQVQSSGTTQFPEAIRFLEQALPVNCVEPTIGKKKGDKQHSIHSTKHSKSNSKKSSTTNESVTEPRKKKDDKKLSVPTVPNSIATPLPPSQPSILHSQSTLPALLPTSTMRATRADRQQLFQNIGLRQIKWDLVAHIDGGTRATGKRHEFTFDHLTIDQIIVTMESHFNADGLRLEAWIKLHQSDTPISEGNIADLRKDLFLQHQKYRNKLLEMLVRESVDPSLIPGLRVSLEHWIRKHGLVWPDSERKSPLSPSDMKIIALKGSSKTTTSKTAIVSNGTKHVVNFEPLMSSKPTATASTVSVANPALLAQAATTKLNNSPMKQSNKAEAEKKQAKITTPSVVHTLIGKDKVSLVPQENNSTTTLLTMSEERSRSILDTPVVNKSDAGTMSSMFPIRYGLDPAPTVSRNVVSAVAKPTARKSLFAFKPKESKESKESKEYKESGSEHQTSIKNSKSDDSDEESSKTGQESDAESTNEKEDEDDGEDEDDENDTEEENETDDEEATDEETDDEEASDEEEDSKETKSPVKLHKTKSGNKLVKKQIIAKSITKSTKPNTFDKPKTKEKIKGTENKGAEKTKKAEKTKETKPTPPTATKTVIKKNTTVKRDEKQKAAVTKAPSKPPRDAKNDPKQKMREEWQELYPNGKPLWQQVQAPSRLGGTETNMKNGGANKANKSTAKPVKPQLNPVKQAISKTLVTKPNITKPNIASKKTVPPEKQQAQTNKQAEQMSDYMLELKRQEMILMDSAATLEMERKRQAEILRIEQEKAKQLLIAQQQQMFQQQKEAHEAKHQAIQMQSILARRWEETEKEYCMRYEEARKDLHEAIKLNEERDAIFEEQRLILLQKEKQLTAQKNSAQVPIEPPEPIDQKESIESNAPSKPTTDKPKNNKRAFLIHHELPASPSSASPSETDRVLTVLQKMQRKMDRLEKSNRKLIEQQSILEEKREDYKREVNDDARWVVTNLKRDLDLKMKGFEESPEKQVMRAGLEELDAHLKQRELAGLKTPYDQQVGVDLDLLDPIAVFKRRVDLEEDFIDKQEQEYVDGQKSTWMGVGAGLQSLSSLLNPQRGTDKETVGIGFHGLTEKFSKLMDEPVMDSLMRERFADQQEGYNHDPHAAFFIKAVTAGLENLVSNPMEDVKKAGMRAINHAQMEANPTEDDVYQKQEDEWYEQERLKQEKRGQSRHQGGSQRGQTKRKQRNVARRDQRDSDQSQHNQQHQIKSNRRQDIENDDQQERRPEQKKETGRSFGKMSAPVKLLDDDDNQGDDHERNQGGDQQQGNQGDKDLYSGDQGADNDVEKKMQPGELKSVPTMNHQPGMNHNSLSIVVDNSSIDPNSTILERDEDQENDGTHVFTEFKLTKSDLQELAEEEALEKDKGKQDSRLMKTVQPLFGGMNKFSKMLKVQKKHEQEANAKIANHAREINVQNAAWKQKMKQRHE